MTLPDFLFTSISIIMMSVGVMFLLIPEQIQKLEKGLNTAWGGREILAIRVGAAGEEQAEKLLNKPILNHGIHWDGWVHKHPRLTGGLLCGLAVALLWSTAS